ncbi:Zinc carboxypeptidase A 1, partial [Operophtera brumata]
MAFRTHLDYIKTWFVRMSKLYNQLFYGQRSRKTLSSHFVKRSKIRTKFYSNTYCESIAIAVTSAVKNYDGYKVYKVEIKTNDELNVLKDVQSRNIGEFWEDQFDVSHVVKIMVAPARQVQFLEVLKSADVEVSEVIRDLQGNSMFKQYLRYHLVLHDEDEMCLTRVGASDDACSNTYAGPTPASEPETKAIAQYAQYLSENGRLIYYIAFHSYTQLIIVPYSHLSSSADDGRPDNYGDMLRDLGEFGFLLNREQIIPTAVEIMAALLEMDKTTREIGYYVIEVADNSATGKEVSLAALIATTVHAEYKSYRKYKVYKTVPETEKEVELFIQLRRSGWYFWSDKISVGGDVRVMVAPEKQKEFEDKLSSSSVHSNVLHRPANLSRQIGEYSWNYYQNLEEINAWIDAVAAEHSDIVTVVTIGQSVEGRDIRGVKIDYNKHENQTIGMIEGGIHAREWISPATVTWIIKEFLESNDPDVRLLAENVVWHIFPVVNPDGYAYTFTNNRMWRKNRNTSNFTSCAQWNLDSDVSNGIDLNRNFGFLWMNSRTLDWENTRKGPKSSDIQ